MGSEMCIRDSLDLVERRGRGKICVPQAHKVPLHCDHAKTSLRIAESCVRMRLESASGMVNAPTVHFSTPECG